MVPNWDEFINSSKKKMKANEILQEALTVLEKYVPANTPDGVIIGKIEKAIARFKLNSRNQSGEKNE